MRYLAKQKVKTLEQLKEFDELGYRFELPSLADIGSPHQTVLRSHRIQIRSVDTS